MKANDIQCELLQYNSIITEVILTIVLPSLYVFNNNYSVISWWSVLLPLLNRPQEKYRMETNLWWSLLE